MVASSKHTYELTREITNLHTIFLHALIIIIAKSDDLYHTEHDSHSKKRDIKSRLALKM